MTGRVYPSGASRRHNRQAAHRRDWLRSVRDGLAIVGSGAGLAGLGVLTWAAPSKAYLALGLIATAGLLLATAAHAQYRVWRSTQAEPPAMEVQPVRYHIDDAPTVNVGPRRRR